MCGEEYIGHFAPTSDNEDIAEVISFDQLSNGRGKKVDFCCRAFLRGWGNKLTRNDKGRM